MGRQGDRKVWHVALITIVGPLSCAATSAAFNAVAFRELGDAAFAQAMFSAVALPLALGIPLFLYASLKLAELSDVNEKLGIIAATDGLTQCLNHRAFSTLVSLSVQPEAPGESTTTGAFLIVDAIRSGETTSSGGSEVKNSACFCQVPTWKAPNAWQSA
jgi:diguanylate cyclase